MLAVVGGTGLNQFELGEDCAQVSTPYGDASAAAVKSSVDGQSFIFLARHGRPHVIAPHNINYRANMWLLRQLGVTQIIAVNAVGGINTSMGAGSIVVPDQLIDFTYGRNHTFYDGVDYGDGALVGLEHIDFSFPFSENLRRAIFAASRDQAQSMSIIEHGVYAVTQGPRLETAAEINHLERAGADIVGMTLMPEAALARELGMEYASICLVVNPAAGRGDGLITMDDIHRVIDSGMKRVRQLLGTAIVIIGSG